MRRPSRLGRILVVVSAALLALAGSTVVVRRAYRPFPGATHLSGLFAAAGEGLVPGSEVDYRGVRVGQVTAIQLHDRAALVAFEVERGLSVPSDAVATLRPKSLFGDEFVDLSFPDGSVAPFLISGERVGHTAVAPQLGDLIATSVPLLQDINPSELASIVSSLSQSVQGEGPAIAASLADGTRLSDVLASTIQDQLHALDALDHFQSAIADQGAALDAIAGNANTALPVINAAEESLQHLLDSLQPVANDLSQLLIDYRPSIDTLLRQGDDVTRVLLANQTNISSFIHGAYRYFFKVQGALGAGPLPDGSHFAYFKNFILFSQVNQLVCSLIAPAQAGLAFLKPLQQVVAAVGAPLDCSQYLAAFDAAEDQPAPPAAPPLSSVPATSSSGPAVTGRPGPSPAPAPPSPASGGAGSLSPVLPSASQILQGLAGRVFSGLGQPHAGSAGPGGGLSTILRNALGGQ